MNPIDFIENYCDWSNPETVWMLKTAVRNKDNDPKTVKELKKAGKLLGMRRLVLTRPEDIERCYEEQRVTMNCDGIVYRMYVSLNSRNTVSAAFHFQKKMADICYDLHRRIQDAVPMSQKVASYWKTELEQKRNRGTKRILFDIDEPNGELYQEIKAKLEELNVAIHAARMTSSNYAIVCDSHDVRWAYKAYKERDLDIQKDSMVYVEEWTGGEA